MTVVVAKSETDLDFDGLIAAVCDAVPGTVVTKPDYYADRITRTVAITKQLRLSPSNAPLVCLRRVAAEHGIQREISIPLANNESFIGRVDRFGGLFTGPKVTVSEIAPVLDVLARFGLHVEVLW